MKTTDVLTKIKHAKRQNSQNIDLSNLDIETLPSELYQLKLLLFLNCSNNKISSIDKQIENMKNLKEANFENNNITELPKEILLLENLTCLKLAGNPIFSKLKDFKYDWKNSMREYFDSDKKEEVPPQSEVVDNNMLYPPSEIKQRPNSMKGSKPFSNFNISHKINITNLQRNTGINFLKKSSKGAPGIIGEIPKCNFFENINAAIKNKDDAEIIPPEKLTEAKPFIKKQTLSQSKQFTMKSTIKDEDNNKETGEYNNEFVKNEDLDNPNLKLAESENEISQLKLMLSQKDEYYKSQIAKLENEIKALNNKGKSGTVPVEKETLPLHSISNKRNWMDNDPPTIGNSSVSSNLSHSNFAELPSDSRFRDLENQLQKEQMANKRMKNEIERLSQQIALNKSTVSNDTLMKNLKEISYEDIDIQNKIGEGGFSMIYKGIWNMLPVAVKIIFDPNVTDELLTEFNNEIKMLFSLRHPNIITLLGISTKPQKLAIITEYVEKGSLFDILHKSSKEISMPVKIKIIYQLIRTFLYMHQCGIVHRDIKSHNVLIDEHFDAKLCDFGLAKNISELNWGSGQFAGTPCYMAPELFMKKAYDEKIDVFSFGTLLWEILVRKIPYEGYDASEIKAKVISGEELFIPKAVPAELGAIITNCRSFDPANRPSFVNLSNIKLA